MTALTERSGVGRAEADGAPSSRAVAAAPRRRPRLTRTHLILALVFCSVFAMGSAWAMGQPAPAGVDEPSHYVKALGAGQGDFLGIPTKSPNEYLENAETRRLTEATTRSFSVPGHLTPDQIYACTAVETVTAACSEHTLCQRYLHACPDTSTDVPGNVREISYTGTYEPTLYVLPGLAARLADNDQTGLRFARLAAALFAAVVLTVAAALLWDRRRPAFALIGLVVAVTPMVVHINSVINPSGGEIVLAVCFAAAVLRIARDRGRPRPWVWMALGISGSLLAFARQLGPVWVVMGAVLLLALLGIRHTVWALRTQRIAWLATGLIVLGVAADFTWWHVVGRGTLDQSLSSAPGYIVNSFDSVTYYMMQEIGIFGWYDIQLRDPEKLIWSVMAVALVIVALLLGTPRQRVVLILAVIADILATVVLTVLTGAIFAYSGGQGMEGRYVLPMSVMVALLAGEIIRDNRDRAGAVAPRRLILYMALGAVFCQVGAFWLVARRYAVGFDGPLWFLGSSAWSPPGGWAPWLLLLFIGCACTLAVAVLSVRWQPQAEVTLSGGRPEAEPAIAG